MGHAYQCFRKRNAANVGLMQASENPSTQDRDDSAAESVQRLSVNSDLFSLNNLQKGVVPKKVLLKLIGKYCYFQIDTGACRSVIMSSGRFKNLLNVSLRPVNYRLNVVSGLTIRAVGECEVDVVCGKRKVKAFTNCYRM